MDIVRVFRIVSLAEATSFLLLLVASVLKRTASFPEGVTVLGPIHGVLFLVYVALVFMSRSETRWSNGRMALALLASILPVAPYFVERKWLREVQETAVAKGAGVS